MGGSFLAAKGPEGTPCRVKGSATVEGGFDGSVCRYPTTGEGLVHALASPGSLSA